MLNAGANVVGVRLVRDLAALEGDGRDDHTNDHALQRRAGVDQDTLRIGKQEAWRHRGEPHGRTNVWS